MTYGAIWSNEEIALLRKHYPLLGAKACIPHLQNKTARQIRHKARCLHLEVVSHHWSEKEIEIIHSHYPTGGPKACRARGIERSMTAIKSKARDMGVYNKRKAVNALEVPSRPERKKRVYVADFERIDPNAPQRYRPTLLEGVWKPESHPLREGAREFLKIPSLVGSCER